MTERWPVPVTAHQLDARVPLQSCGSSTVVSNEFVASSSVAMSSQSSLGPPSPTEADAGSIKRSTSIGLSKTVRFQVPVWSNPEDEKIRLASNKSDTLIATISNDLQRR